MKGFESMRTSLLRKLSFGAAAAAMVIPTVGGAHAATTATKAKAPVNLIWFMRTEPKENPWENAQVTAWNASHPNIHVQLITAPNPNGQFDAKFNTLLNSTPADIWSHLGQDGFADYYHRGLLYDYTPLIKKYGYNAGGTPQNLLNTYKIGSGLYGIPSITLGSFTFYNKDMIDAYNKAHPGDKIAYPPVSWDDKSWTWSKMVSIATKLTNKSKHQYGVVQGLFPFMGYAYLAGTDMFPAGTYQSGTPKSFTATQPAVVDLFQQIGDWANKSKIAPSYSDQKAVSNQGLDNFMTGNVGMILTGGWGFRNYNSVKFRWGAAPLPYLKSNKDVLFTDPYMLYKKSKHPAEAFQFIKFLTSRAPMEAYVKQVSFTPSNPDFLGNWYKLNAQRTGMTAEQLQTLLAGSRKYGQESPNHLVVHFSQIHNTMQQDIDPIWFGQKTAKDQMPTVEQDIQAILARG